MTVEEYTVEGILAQFWEWRKRGRTAQTLQQDLEMFCGVWIHRAGFKICKEVYEQAMACQEWDISQGGLVPMKPEPKKPEKKGLRAYG